ncbi:MAG: hypothetical protein JRJ59_11580 [Deltaproteobacteria bacterium]|nr:hypothetical protein [Deltaproteobacteria bacterium]
MNVVEKDGAVQGLLEDELSRCRQVQASLEAKLAKYPKGALNVRKKRYKDKQYEYHYLVARKGDKVINRHVPAEEAAKLKKQLAERDKIRQELWTYRKRSAYLVKLLKA